jgi:aryl-alcohol dehydrogenase-like predicted oxidoreductase
MVVLTDGPAEDLYGMLINRVRRERPPELLVEIKGYVSNFQGLYGTLMHLRYFSSCCLLICACSLTKWVPPPVKMTRKYVEDNINRSRKRMDVAALDMLQFHWYISVFAHNLS